MKRKTDPLDSVAGQILENAKKSGLEINLRDRKSTRLNSSHLEQSRMPSSA